MSRRSGATSRVKGGLPGTVCGGSCLSYAVSDSATMLRRNLKHALRYPSLTVSVVAMRS